MHRSRIQEYMVGSMMTTHPRPKNTAEVGLTEIIDFITTVYRFLSCAHDESRATAQSRQYDVHSL